MSQTLMTAGYQKILFYLISRQIKKLGFSKPILWIYPPSAVDLIGMFDEKSVIYHCIADFPNEKRNFLRRKTIISMECELIRKANIIFTLTDGLHKRFREKNQKRI